MCLVKKSLTFAEAVYSPGEMGADTKCYWTEDWGVNKFWGNWCSDVKC